MGRVQRAPGGLLDVLSIKGVDALPQELSKEVRGVLELIQFYGLQQRQTLIAQNAAVAEATGVSIQPSVNSWSVLFGISMSISKTATMTALAATLLLNRSNTAPGAQPVAYQSFEPFGATETGVVALAWWAPYPVMLPPGSFVTGSLAILGTDVTANVVVTAEVGLLG